MSEWLHDYSELAWRGLSEWEILQSGSLGPLWSGCLLHILLTASINPKSAGNFTSKNKKWKWSNLAVSTSLNFYWLLLIIIWLWINFYHLQYGMKKKHTPWYFRIEQCLKTCPSSEGEGKSLKQGWPALQRTQGGNFSFPKTIDLGPLCGLCSTNTGFAEAFGGSLITNGCSFCVGRPRSGSRPWSFGWGQLSNIVFFL